MQKNVGGYDRLARSLLGLALVILAVAAWGEYVVLTGFVGAAVIWGALVVGLALLVAAVTQKSLLNEAFGFDTYGDPTSVDAETDADDVESRRGRPT